MLYAIAGWIVIEVAATVLPGLNLPDWTITLVIVLVALGFIVAIMLAWAFDIGPQGIERTESHRTSDDNAPQTGEREIIQTKASTPLPPRSEPGNEEISLEEAAETDNRRSIAVLPFVNMS